MIPRSWRYLNADFNVLSNDISGEAHLRHALADLSSDIDQLVDLPLAVEDVDVFVESGTL